MGWFLLSLGSNLDDKLAHLRQGIDRLSSYGTVSKKASVYETSPIGMEGKVPNFYNTAVLFDTKLNPEELLPVLKNIEQEMGRDMSAVMKSRPLDIDIIIWSGGEWSQDNLIIPHPRAAERLFVIKPINEIMPNSFTMIDDKSQGIKVV